MRKGSSMPAAPRAQLGALVDDDPNDLILIRRGFERARVADKIRSLRSGTEVIAYLNGAAREQPYEAGGEVASGMTWRRTDGETESSPLKGWLWAAISTTAAATLVAKIVRMIRFAARLSLWTIAIA